MIGVKKRGILLSLITGLFALILLTASIELVSAGISGNISLNLSIAHSDVAYIYNQNYKIDQNVIGEFERIGLSVEPIKSSAISTTDFSKYRLIFVGDERFRNAADIPITNYPTIIANYYHGSKWGLTDNDEISKLVSTDPLSVTYNNGLVQIYTESHYKEGNTLSIPYYYLADGNKAASLVKIAGTNIGANHDLGDVIAYGAPGSQLVNGDYLNEKLCYYGIVKSDYWTEEARQLFHECAAYVAMNCMNNSDCPEPVESDSYCNGNNVYKDVSTYSCVNPATLNATCIATGNSVLVEQCDNVCFEGACVECNVDNDCNDNNPRTIDSCENHQCNYENITCLFDSDCGETGFIGDNFCTGNNVFRNYQNATCLRPGTLQSDCLVTQIPQLTNDCNDNNNQTVDSCSNGVCQNNLLQCIMDSQCGTKTSQLICSGNVVMNRTINPICSSNSCSNQTTDSVLRTCDYQCSNGACINAPVNCTRDLDCNDENAQTNDVCINPGTPQSYCNHNPLQCINNNQCGLITSSLLCSGNNVINRTIMPVCSNNNCSSQTNDNVFRYCANGCLNGACINAQINCTIDSQCNDNNPKTIDQCVNAGTPQSYCRNAEMNCLRDIDCGATGFIGSEFCSQNNIFKNYQNATCVNAGTAQSNCIVTQVPKLTKDCNDNNPLTSDTCSNGACVYTNVGECTTDNQCSDNNESTYDRCINNHCQHDNIICFVNGDCNDGNSGTIDICVNGGSINSYCRHDQTDGQICREICTGGAIDFDLLIDTSGSMNLFLDPSPDKPFERVVKIKSARDAADELAQEAFAKNSNTKIGIDTFSNEIFNNLNLTSNLSAVDAVILRIFAGGNANTNYNESIVGGINKLVSQGRAGSPKVLIFLSDGQPSVVNSHDNTGAFVDAGDIQSSIDAAVYAKNNNIIMIIIGFGRKADVNETLLQQMAQITGGKYFFVSTNGGLMDLYERIGRDTCSIICTNPICSNNNDCNDGNAQTNDVCVNPGTEQSYCRHDIISCSNNNDCDDSNSYTNDVCMNPGTPQSYCNHNPLQCISNSDCNDNNDLTEDRCINNQCVHNQLQCVRDSQCGSQSNQRICIGNNVINRMTTSRCISNSCSSETIDNLFEQCSSQCSNGACIIQQVTCSYDSQCNDGNIRTVDKCINPGSANSYCTHNEVDCLYDNDCGETGFIGSTFCSLNNVFKIYQESKCQNPGTLESNCMITQTQRLVNSCDDGNIRTVDSCSNGVCQHNNLECLNNNDCNDGNNQTNDRCNLINNRCEHDTIVCSFDSQCNDGNAYTTDICMNPGTPQSYCNHNPLQCISNSDCNDNNAQTNDRCVNSQCVHDNLQCINDQQCGSLISQRICSGNNVIDRMNVPRCISNSCSSETIENFVQQCSYQCFNSSCINAPIRCSLDSQCNDNNAYTIDQCVNAGSANSYCRNAEMNCLSNNDCEFSGFIGNEFCSLNSIFKNYQNATCINPGTLESNCIVTITSKLTRSCDDGNVQTTDSCANGACVNTILQCINDGQCNDNNNFTLDKCTNNICIHTPIVCFVNSDCNDNNAQTQDVCINPGTPQSYCVHNPLQCINNNQCGAITSSLLCSGNNVINRTTIPSCVGNICRTDSGDAIVEQCANGCLNSACILKKEICDNRIDDDSDGLIDYMDVIDCPANQCTSQGKLVLFPMPGLGVGSPWTPFERFNNYKGCCYSNQCYSGNEQKGGCFVNNQKLDLSDSEFGVLLCSVAGNNARWCKDGFVNDGSGNCICPSGTQYNSTSKLCSPIIIKCSYDIQCNDNNAQTQDVCMNPGTPQSYCNHNPLQCINNNQCGLVTSSLLCSGNNVINRTLTPSCVGNICQTNTNDINVKTCQYGCANGACLPQCTLDSQCNDNNQFTLDKCTNNICIHTPLQCIANINCGVVTSQLICSGNNVVNKTITPICSNNNCSSQTSLITINTCQYGCANGACIQPIINCTTNVQCNDNNAQTQDVCMNPGTPQSYCVHNPLQCINNNQCGLVTSSLLCSGNNVINRTTIPSCVGNICRTDSGDAIVEQCANGCENGKCKKPNGLDIIIPGGNENDYNSVCPASGFWDFFWGIEWQNDPEKYAEVKTNINASGIEAGKAYNFYCTYGSETQPGSPVTIVPDATFRTIESSTEAHRKSDGVCPTVPLPGEDLGFICNPPQESGIIKQASDNYEWKVALVDGKLKFRVYRQMGGKYYSDMGGRDNPGITLTSFYVPKPCPVYSVQTALVPGLRYTSDNSFSQYMELNYGTQSLVPAIKVYGWEGIKCQIRAV
ncbi:MAG: vWA domain-containing protein [Candidatus Pacearchaeota archaeon]|jgi:Mg-chelatase subunit ChlD